MNNVTSASDLQDNGVKDKAHAVSVHNVWKSFDKGKISVLEDVSLQVKKEELVALWGTSGSGKSTLLHLIGGLDSADRGTVHTAGIDVSDRRELLRLRREKVGFVFQLHNLIPDLTLLENCLVPAIAAGVPLKTAQEQARRLARNTKLEHRLQHRIQNLSGGERQRTAVCRALMNQPEIILADEPTGSLDEATGEQIFEMLMRLAKDEKVTVIMATHERRFANACDRIFQVRNGGVGQI